jgi:hypothetical protein
MLKDTYAMKCQRPECPNEIERTSSRGNNKKYCCPECQQIHYKVVNAKRIKENANRHNHAKWCKYEVGKEKCVICEAEGVEAWYWAVCQHVVQRHGMSEHEYKKLIGADVSKGRIPPKLKRLKAQYVFENGTVKNLAKGKSQRYKKGDPRAGVYERSAETLTRLKTQHSLWKKRKSGTKKKATVRGVSKIGKTKRATSSGERKS